MRQKGVSRRKMIHIRPVEAPSRTSISRSSVIQLSRKERIAVRTWLSLRARFMLSDRCVLVIRCASPKWLFSFKSRITASRSDLTSLRCPASSDLPLFSQRDRARRRDVSSRGAVDGRFALDAVDGRVVALGCRRASGRAYSILRPRFLSRIERAELERVN